VQNGRHDHINDKGDKMPPIILSLIPTIIKAVIGMKGAPKVADAINKSVNPKENKKALFTAGIALLAYYGVTVAPEWLNFASALWPVIAAYAAAFAVSKAPDAQGLNLQ